MEMVKKFGPGAVLALVGIKGSEVVGFKTAWAQVGAAVVGSFLGLVLAAQLGGKKG